MHDSKRRYHQNTHTTIKAHGNTPHMQHWGATCIANLTAGPRSPPYRPAQPQQCCINAQGLPTVCVLKRPPAQTHFVGRCIPALVHPAPTAALTTRAMQLQAAAAIAAYIQTHFAGCQPELQDRCTGCILLMTALESCNTKWQRAQLGACTAPVTTHEAPTSIHEGCWRVDTQPREILYMQTTDAFRPFDPCPIP